MNKKGQSLPIAVILIPLFFIALSFVFEYAFIINHNHKYTEISESIILEANGDLEKIKRLYEFNGYSIEELNYITENGHTYIYNNNRYDSVFGLLIGHKEYKSEISYELIYDINGKVSLKEYKEDKK